MISWDWENGSAGKALTMQAQGPEFNPQTPYLKRGAWGCAFVIYLLIQCTQKCKNNIFVIPELVS